MTIAVPHAVTREIRGAMPFSAIVDIDGVHNPKTGGFHQIDDAIDAGHKSIFVRDGTYKSFTADVANLTIMGESIDAIVDGSLTTAHGCTLSAAHVKLIGLTFKTTSGGGDTISGIDCSDAAGDYFLVDRCHFPGSDHNGIDVAVAMNAPVIQSCTFTGTFDSSCVTFGNNTQHGKLFVLSVYISHHRERDSRWAILGNGYSGMWLLPVLFKGHQHLQLGDGVWPHASLVMYSGTIPDTPSMSGRSRRTALSPTIFSTATH